MNQFTLESGSSFAGRYKVLACLAAGGMGAVYEVLHVETQRKRALKVMLPSLLQSDEHRQRFQREARVTAGVVSDHLVDVFDAGVDPQSGIPFLAMELLNGEDLAKRVERSGPLPASEVVTYLRQVASALDRTHAAAIVHRDLKPQNLFLTFRDDGTPCVKILDFGIAKVLREGSANLTASLGTPMYMAPEQLGMRPVGLTTDVYALGHVAYALLAGEPYFQSESRLAESVFAFMYQVARGPEEPPVTRAARLGVALPPAFDAWFLRATAQVPEHRFESAGRAIRELAEALGFAPNDELPPRIEPLRVGAASASLVTPGPTETLISSDARVGKNARRRIVVTLLGLALVGAAGLAFWLWPSRHIPDSVPGAEVVPSASVASTPRTSASEPSVTVLTPTASAPPASAPSNSATVSSRPKPVARPRTNAESPRPKSGAKPLYVRD